MMLLSNMPLLMVMAFLLITLIVGLYFSRKITTLREYAVGNKTFTTATLVATMLATNFGGGGLIRTVQEVHAQGLYYISFGICANLALWIISPLMLRMAPFMQHLSMAETIGSVYGSSPRVLTALSSICTSIACLAIQIAVMSQAIGMCVTIDSEKLQWITILTASVLVGYSTFGGIRGVAFTDVLQLATFTIIIPVLATVLFKNIGKPIEEMVPVLQCQEKFQFSSVFHFDTKLLAMFALCLADIMSYIDPTTIQRVYMCSGPMQAKKVCLYSSMFSVMIIFIIILIGLFVFAEAPALPKENIWPYITNHIPSIFKGVLAISLLAMAMSTADSELNSCSVMVSHDMVESLRGIRLPHAHRFRIVRYISLVIGLLRKAIPYTYPLRLARLASLMIGALGMLLTFKCNNLLSLLKLSFDFSVPIITAPFLLAIFGFRGTSRTALIGMTTGILAIWAWNKWLEPQTSIDGSFFCMLANGLAMIIAHYLLPQPAGTGWVGPDDTYTAYKQNKTYATKLRKESLRAFFSNPKAYLNTLKPSDSTFIGTGLYIIINGLLSWIYYWNAGWHLGPILLFVIGFSLVSYALFLKKYPVSDWSVTFYLWLSLLSALPVHSLFSWFYLPYLNASAVLTLILSFTHIALLLSLLPLYVGLLTAMPLFCLYVCCCYKIAFLWLSAQLFLPLLGTAILFFGFILYAKQRLDKVVAQRKLVELRNAYEERVSLETIYNQANLARLDAYAGSNLLIAMGKTLQETLQSLDTATPIKKEIDLFLKKLAKVGHLWLDRSQEERSMALNPKDISSIDIASTILKIYGYIQTLDASIQFYLRNRSRIIAITADPALLECLVMLNIWELSKSRPETDQELTLTLADTTLHYGHSPTGAEDATDTSFLALPAVAFAFSPDRVVRKILPHYTVTHTAAYTVLPKTEAAFYQLKSRQIVEAHGGYTEIIESSEALTCLYVLPVKGKQVMHLKTYDSADLVAAKVAETEESIAQEKALTALLTTNTRLTQEKVTQTIAFIKKAHGLVVRKSSAPYYTHPMEVAKILLEVTEEPDTILAGLLHDVVEDTPITLHQITMMYGEEVALLVDKVTEYHTNGYCWKLEKNQQKEILEACGDKRVVQIKLADRLHNMRTLYARKREDQRRIAQETLTFYIPWGGRNKGPEAWLREMRQICEEVIDVI